jgi:hypothetical protein
MGEVDAEMDRNREAFEKCRKSWARAGVTQDRVEAAYAAMGRIRAIVEDWEMRWKLPEVYAKARNDLRQAMADLERALEGVQ